MELKNIEECETAISFDNVSESINIEFQNLCYKGAPKKCTTDRQYIVNNVSGAFYSSRLSAVLGSSGSGKTTLLNLLAGLQSNSIVPNIKLNGQISDTHSIRQKSCYIGTNNFPLFSHLTTFETLKFAADFKLSRKISAAAKLKLINNIIEEINLTDYRNLIVTKLNESQRNVLAIGIGLLTNSPILYFDLGVRYFKDNALLLVLTYLKILVGHGRTIICALDQPTTKMLQYFDDVLVLADGQSIYCGPSDKTDELFAKAGQARPSSLGQAEFILDIASQSEVEQQFHQLPMNNLNTTTNVKTGKNWCYPITYWSQFTILMRRSILSLRRDFMFVHLRLFMNAITGLFLGMVYFDFGNSADKIISNTTLLYFMVLFVFFVNVIPNFLSMPADIEVFLQEQKHHYYSMNVYFIVKIITEVIQHIIGSTVFLVIIFFMTQQPIPIFFYLWTIFILAAIVSLGVSLVIAVSIQNSSVRIYTMLFINVPMMIFSGMFIKFNEFSPYLKPACYISYFRYVFEGSMHSIYGFNRPKLECYQEYCYFKIPDRYLETVLVGSSLTWYNDVAGLGIWVVILFGLFYMVLKFRVAYSK